MGEHQLLGNARRPAHRARAASSHAPAVPCQLIGVSNSNTALPLLQPVRESINESFVHGFRGVMVLGAVLALASGITSLLLISGRAARAQPPDA